MSNIARVSIAALAGAVLLSGASVASAANFTVGDKIVVVDAVKVRETANGVHINSQQRGAMGTIIGGPIVVGGYTWWNVNFDKGVDGWSAEDFMQLSTVSLTSTSGKVAGVSTSYDGDVEATIAKLTAQLQALMNQLMALQAGMDHSQMDHSGMNMNY